MGQDSEECAPENQLADMCKTVTKRWLETVLENFGEREWSETGLTGDSAVKRRFRVLVIFIVYNVEHYDE